MDNDFTDEDYMIPPVKYEYLDHPADIQLHSWGESLEEAFEQCAIAMFNYMSPIDEVEILDKYDIESEGHDLESLLYNFLDELLFMFSAEPFLIARKIKITEFDKTNFRIKAIAFGEEFTLDKHEQGTEIKAITYSAMKIIEPPDSDKFEVYVIVDI